MKLAYVYFNDLNKNSANVNQTFNMVSSFTKYSEVYFLSGYIKKSDLKRRLDFFGLSHNFYHVRLLTLLFTKNKFIEFALRGIYCIQSLVVLNYLNVDYIYTRDFSFIYFISNLPCFLRPKQKIIYEPHTIYHKSSSKVSLAHERKALKVPDLFIPISNGIKIDLIQNLGIKTNKIYVAADGVNMDLFNNLPEKLFLREKHSIKGADSIIIYAGSFKKWKGVDFLIKAYATISTMCDDTKLILVGGSLGDIARIEQLIDDLHINKKNIILKGFVSQSEVVELLKLSDMGVIPNAKTAIGAKYTSPLKLFEYMACGLPIVASNLPAMREILDETNAVFFEAENSEDLANQIYCLLNDIEKKVDLQHNNLTKINNFTWDARVKKILKWINSSNNHL
ncbi:glycosyltransferase [Methanococcoides methylutens]|uniref:Glycosyltransferase n=1 Tax=Methanococcoides methylutens MM1 TaxID=1434104 RepID=A0A0E3X2B8_METMT|nr:glycosyltransferase [Methanococcoides methylutens]AKB86159.1 Glycosyltransferase [Methanococcoides methylutens MM1]